MKWIYNQILEEHFSENRQMAFLVGPGQAGKTTTCLAVSESQLHHYYLNWDNQSDRIIISEGSLIVLAKTFLSQLI